MGLKWSEQGLSLITPNHSNFKLNSIAQAASTLLQTIVMAKVQRLEGNLLTNDLK